MSHTESPLTSSSVRVSLPARAPFGYDIFIGRGLRHHAGELISAVRKPCRVLLLTDDTVEALYADEVTLSLAETGYTVSRHVIPHGEASKSAANLIALLEKMATEHLTRSDLLVALGGGVVGDLGGFGAAVYQRGIPFIQIPTTLLAAVDSSVGGKTGIDLTAGKNLCGAFYQPSLVLCDTDTLSTLSTDVFSDGCAEVIKYGILYDATLFRYLEVSGPEFDREYVIARCIELKRDAVMLDEFDTGARMLLNLGHTVGHGIEGCSNYTISHGKAVAMGIATVARAVKCIDSGKITACLRQFGLCVHMPYGAEDILPYMLSDKKRNGDTLRLIVPNRIGDCRILELQADEILTFIKEGL
jgi:3-dehydroquinate synthase